MKREVTHISPLRYFDESGNLVEEPYSEVWSSGGEVDVCFNYGKFLKDLETKWNLESWFFKRNQG